MLVGAEHGTPHCHSQKRKHFTVGSEVGIGNGIQQILAHLELNVEIPALAGGLEARIYQILQTW